MRVAARVLVLGMAISVLGAADARAPDMRDGATALASVTGTHESSALLRPNDDAQLAMSKSASSPAPADSRESTPDLWLLGGVGIGLVAYQLRRKHRLLRPQPFQLRSDL